MNRLASREDADAAVITCAMPRSSAQATAASTSVRPTPWRRWSGTTVGV